MINGLLHQEDKTNVIIHALNIEASRYIKQILIEPKGEIDSNKTI